MSRIICVTTLLFSLDINQVFPQLVIGKSTARYFFLIYDIFFIDYHAQGKKIDDIFQVSSTVLQVLHSTVNQQSAGTKTSVKETLGRQ